MKRESGRLEARIEAPDDWRDPEPDRASLRDEQPATPARVPLRAGQNVALNDAALTVTISWRPRDHDLDASAILVNRRGRVRSDADFVFYNQPVTPDGAIRHTAATPGGATATETLDITLNGLHHEVQRVVAAVSVDGGRFADVHDLRASPPSHPTRPPNTCSSPPRQSRPRSSASRSTSETGPGAFAPSDRATPMA